MFTLYLNEHLFPYMYQCHSIIALVTIIIQFIPQLLHKLAPICQTAKIMDFAVEIM